MSVLKMMFAKNAPTHHAEKWWPRHDGALNLVEARRGRGKSYGAVKIALEWLLERWEVIESGAAEYARVITNITFNKQYLAYCLKKMGIKTNMLQLLKILDHVIVYVTEWDEILTAFDSLILIDEANRNLDVYDSSGKNQNFMLVIHDWLQQTRKHKLTLWFFVQDVEWIKQQVRSLMDKLWRAKRVRIKGTMNVKYFPWYGSDPWSSGKDGKLNRNADFKMRFDFDIWVARCYDTLQAVRTLPQETQFRNFGEINDYMVENGLKPGQVIEQKRFFDIEEEIAWWESARNACPQVPPSPLDGGGAGLGGVNTDGPKRSASLAADSGGAAARPSWYKPGGARV